MRRTLLLTVILLALSAGSTFCRAPRLRPANRRASALARPASVRIVFVRGPDERHGGDIWTVGADGRDGRRLTTGESFHALAVDGRRIACLRWGKRSAYDGNVYVLSDPDWRPRRVTSGGMFGEVPCWKPGTDHLFIARRTEDPSYDEGLYDVDVRHGARRKILAPVHDELTVGDMIRLSPRGQFIAGGSGITGWLGFHVLDLKSGKQIKPRGMRGLSGGRGFAWLDEQDLLLAGTPDCPADEKARGGIFRLNLRTRRLTRWLYPASAEVEQICRSPVGDRFAVGLDFIDTPGTVPFMAARIELIDRKTRARHPLRLPGPAHLCGFSRDGTRLLVLVLSRTEPATKDDLYRGMKSDAYVVDLVRSACRRVAREAFDAAWMSGSGSPPGPAHLARRAKAGDR